MPLQTRQIVHAGRRAFGDALAASLRARGMTQTRLAGLLDGMTQSAVSAWVNGDAVPSYELVFRIEEILELTPGYLSRHLGYVPAQAGATTSVEKAVEADPLLSPLHRQALLALYREFTVRQSPRA